MAFTQVYGNEYHDYETGKDDTSKSRRHIAESENCHSLITSADQVWLLRTTDPLLPREREFEEKQGAGKHTLW